MESHQEETTGNLSTVLYYLSIRLEAVEVLWRKREAKLLLTNVFLSVSLYVLKTWTSTSWWRNNDVHEGELLVLSAAEQHELITELQSELNDTFRTTDTNSHHVCCSHHISVFYVRRTCFHLCC